MEKAEIKIWKYPSFTINQIIYWSWTFVLLFISLTIMLESNPSMNRKSVFFMLLFLLLSYFGLRRTCAISEESIEISSYFSKARNRLYYSEVVSIQLKKRKMTIITKDATYIYNIKVKEQKYILNCISEEVSIHNVT